jgi:purine-binding chemotaxis protein CheW
MVHEIIGMMDVTRIPRTPDFIRGVINLRGKVIAVVDLRLKFGLESKEDTELTCVIVVQIAQDDRQMTMGIIVGEVSEVINILADHIEPAPNFGAALTTDFILGMGKIGKKVLTLLDIDKVLSSNEAQAVVEISN